MAATIVFALISVTLFATGHTLKCYYCLGSESSDCSSLKTNSLIVLDCSDLMKSSDREDPFPFLNTTGEPQQFLVPQCFQVLVKTKNYGNRGFQRNCVAFPPNKDLCQTLESNPGYTKCKACKKDLCNNQPK